MSKHYYCSVLHCKSNSKTNKDLKFHGIPKCPERRKYWLEACQRTDLIGKKFRKFVCSLHFDECMYGFGRLLRSAVPILHLTNANIIPDVQDSCSQTWESIQFFGDSSNNSEVPGTLLKKIEVRTSHTQTNITMPCANKIKIKNESNMTCTLMAEYNYNVKNVKQKKDEYDKQLEQAEVNEDELEKNKCVIKMNEDIKPQIVIDDIVQISSDDGEESEDETSEMSIDEFLNLNRGLESQIRKELTKNNIPQIPFEKATSSTASLEIWEPKINEDETESEQNPEGELVRTSVNEFIIDLNQGLEEQIGKAIMQKNIATSNEPSDSNHWIRLHKQTQTEEVDIYAIPKNNRCFQQCLRCGKNRSRILPKYGKPDHMVTIEDFENACDLFLSPMFSTTIKNQIKLERILCKNRYYSYKYHSIKAQGRPKISGKVAPIVKNNKQK